MTEENRALVLLSEAQRAVEKAKTVQELKDVRDKAQAVRFYVKQQGGGLDILNHCAEVKLIAERKAGDLLEKMFKAGERQQRGGDRKSKSPRDTLKLSDLGVKRLQSSRWQAEARVPENLFQRFLRETREKRQELTSKALLRIAQDLRLKDQRDTTAEEGSKIKLDDATEILPGDFATVDSKIPDGAVSLIFTDPPYDRKSLRLYEEVAKLGARVLRPGGSLIAYAPHYALPEILPAMARHLCYHWTCCVDHGGASARLPGKWIFVSWKPLVWFTKGTKRMTREYVADLVKSVEPEKKSHDWEQGITEAQYYIEHLTRKGDLVLDPMCGSGTTLLAGRQLGRKVIGIDIDAGHVNRAKKRLTADATAK